MCRRDPSSPMHHTTTKYRFPEVTLLRYLSSQDFRRPAYELSGRTIPDVEMTVFECTTKLTDQDQGCQRQKKVLYLLSFQGRRANRVARIDSPAEVGRVLATQGIKGLTRHKPPRDNDNWIMDQNSNNQSCLVSGSGCSRRYLHHNPSLHVLY